jgi:hypothetical protein
MQLIIRGDAEAMWELGKRLDMETMGGWTRRPEIEERVRKALPVGTGAYCLLLRETSPGRRSPGRGLDAGPGHGEDLYLSGIVPLEGREALGPDQHDEVVADFLAAVIRPLAHGLGVRILDRPTPLGPSLEDLLSPEALSRLRSFAAGANKGIPHPLDLRRWAGFIGQTHQDEASFDPELLAEWLAEEGFQKEPCGLLVREYESGRRLLSAYDEERR